MGDDKLSVNNMLELAMGLSMASLFTSAMRSTYDTTMRGREANQFQAPPRYIHAIIGGKQEGPFSLGEIMEYIKNGQITPESYIWKPGMVDWKMAKDVEDIGLTVEATPPEMP